MHIPLIDKNKHDIHVRRRNPAGPDKADKATIIEEEDTGQEYLKMKSDGQKFPKPGQSKFSTVDRPKMLQKLFGGHNYVKEVEMVDLGDGNCDYVDITEDGNGYDLQVSGNKRLVETSRSIASQKYSNIFEKKDKSEMFQLASYALLVAVQLGGMYILVNGLEQGIVDAVVNGVQAAQNAGQAAQGAAP